MDGWVKLWRKSIDTGLIKNHNVWIFWTYCLMKANHEKNYKCIVGFQEVILNPGQFIFGRGKASDETGLSEQNIRTCLTFLKKCKNLTIKSTNKFSVITITNWGTYQDDNNQANRQTNQCLTSSQPASNQQVTTYKNQRTKEPKKNIPPKSPKGTKTSLKKYLNEKIIENSFIESKDLIIEFFEYRMSKPKSKQYGSERSINGLFRDLNGCRDSGMIVSECIEISMEKGWQTPSPKYFDNKSTNGRVGTDWAHQGGQSWADWKLEQLKNG